MFDSDAGDYFLTFFWRLKNIPIFTNHKTQLIAHEKIFITVYSAYALRSIGICPKPGGVR